MCEWISNIRYIDSANPLLKLEVQGNWKIKTYLKYYDLDELSNVIKLDITIDEGIHFGRRAHLGLETNEMIRNLLYQHPFLQNLVVTIKRLLYVKGLNCPFQGGLGSYCVVLMAIAYLNSKPIHSL